jgi:S1-C subfamily serine protease
MNNSPESDDESGAISNPRRRGADSNWSRTVLVLGVVLIVAVAAVAGIALWPRNPSSPVSVESPAPTTTSPPSPSPSPTPAGEIELSPAELASQFGDAVWQVQAEGCGYVSLGTAFAVGPRTLVTNAHVVENDATPVITSRDGRRDVSAVVAGADVDLDVAVLVVDEDLPVQPLSWISASDLAEGDSLVALGYPVPDHSFTVTPATVMSFQSDGAVREALRLDGVIDKGNSGGPALTATGQVAGVVTSLLNSSGLQWIGVAYTHEYLADAIRTMERDRPGLEVACDEPASPPVLPDEWEWDDEPDWDVTGPDGYGDDPELDELYEACGDGDMVACDDLYVQSPYGSDYESFGSTCGGIEVEMFGACSWLEEEWEPEDSDEWQDEEWEDPQDYGDDPYLDGLWDDCAAGDMDGCDTLYYDAPIGSAYEEFGASCGGYVEDPLPGFCTDSTE